MLFSAILTGFLGCRSALSNLLNALSDLEEVPMRVFSLWLLLCSGLSGTLAGCDDNNGGNGEMPLNDATAIDAVVDMEVDAALTDATEPDATVDAVVPDAGPAWVAQGFFLGRSIFNSLDCPVEQEVDAAEPDVEPDADIADAAQPDAEVHDAGPEVPQFNPCSPGLSEVPEPGQVGYAYPADGQGSSPFYDQSGAAVEQHPEPILRECAARSITNWGTFSVINGTGNWTAIAETVPNCLEVSREPLGEPGTEGYRQQPTRISVKYTYSQELQTEENLEDYRQVTRVQVNSCEPEDETPQCNKIECVYEGRALAAFTHPSLPPNPEFVDMNGMPLNAISLNDLAHPNAECGAYGYDMQKQEGPCFSGVLLYMECFRAAPQKDANWLARAQRANAAWAALAGLPTEKVGGIVFADDGAYQSIALFPDDGTEFMKRW